LLAARGSRLPTDNTIFHRGRRRSTAAAGDPAPNSLGISRSIAPTVFPRDSTPFVVAGGRRFSPNLCEEKVPCRPSPSGRAKPGNRSNVRACRFQDTRSLLRSPPQSTRCEQGCFSLALIFPSS
jgi:hypothetical protein